MLHAFSGIVQAEVQIPRGRCHDHAVGAVGGVDRAAITNPARRAQDTIGLQGVTARRDIVIIIIIAITADTADTADTATAQVRSRLSTK